MKNTWLWAVLIMISHIACCQEIEGDRIKLDSRNVAGLPGSQEDIHQKTRDWFGTNFASLDDIIIESSPDQIVATYYDDCTVLDRRVYFNHDMVIDFTDNSILVELWVRDQKDKNKSAREFFYKKNGSMKSSSPKPVIQLVERGRFFISELEDYLRSN